MHNSLSIRSRVVELGLIRKYHFSPIRC
uniref:Uncharacterized protein n=1 Tax=Heterorhabditis bacteriophora TaxID=37862 RepID=A0A1I7WAW2_HETBA